MNQLAACTLIKGFILAEYVYIKVYVYNVHSTADFHISYFITVNILSHEIVSYHLLS